MFSPHTQKGLEWVSTRVEKMDKESKMSIYTSPGHHHLCFSFLKNWIGRVWQSLLVLEEAVIAAISVIAEKVWPKLLVQVVSLPGDSLLVFALLKLVMIEDYHFFFLLNCIQGDLSMSEAYNVRGIVKNKAKDKVAKIPIRKSDAHNN